MAQVPVYPPVRKAEISLYYEDRVTRGSHTFSTVQELAEFLRDNPEVGKAVGYVKKNK